MQSDWLAGCSLSHLSRTFFFPKNKLILTKRPRECRVCLGFRWNRVRFLLEAGAVLYFGFGVNTVDNALMASLLLSSVYTKSSTFQLLMAKGHQKLGRHRARTAGPKGYSLPYGVINWGESWLGLLLGNRPSICQQVVRAGLCITWFIYSIFFYHHHHHHYYFHLFLHH